MEKKIVWLRIRKSGFFIIGFTVLVTILILSFLAPVICKYNPEESSLSEKLMKPEYFARGMEGHILGTDHLGRDILTRLLYGARLSIAIALVVCIGSAIIGTFLGVIAGYYGGWVDNVIMRTIEVINAIPNLVLAIVILSLFGPSVLNMIIILAIGRFGMFARLARTNTLSLKSQEFVKASKSMGAGNMHIMFTQIFPNITTPLIVQLSQAFGSNIMIESSLSFLGMGIQAPTPSWGGMIADGRKFLATSPWVCFAPGVALMLVVLAFNFLGDGLRDILDVKRT